MPHASQPNFLLIGIRGSGKTTIAREVAKRCNLPSIDVDDLTPQYLGVPTVADAWRIHGESKFRTAEVQALTDALRTGGRIIALGGGTPTAPGAADLIQAERTAGRAKVIYLRCTPDELKARMIAAGGMGANRPSLTGANPLDEIYTIFARRDPLYASLADLVLESPPTIESATASIAQFIAASHQE